jgi:hypothetical protein
MMRFFKFPPLAKRSGSASNPGVLRISEPFALGSP